MNVEHKKKAGRKPAFKGCVTRAARWSSAA
jgi:hypothetical protein